MATRTSQQARAGLESLLHLGGRPSRMNPELTSLNRLEPHATLVPYYRFANVLRRL